jgi:hypothetical protein
MPIRRTVDGGFNACAKCREGSDARLPGCAVVTAAGSGLLGLLPIVPKSCRPLLQVSRLIQRAAVLRRKLTLGGWPITAREAGCGGETRLRHPSCPTALKEHQGASSATRAQPQVRSGPSTDTKHRRARRFSLQRALNTGPTRMSQHQQHREPTTPFILRFSRLGPLG